MKYLVSNCENYSDQITFIGKLCVPCYKFLVEGEDVYSQAYKNAQEKLFFIESKHGSYGLTVYLIVKAKNYSDAVIKAEIKDDLVNDFGREIIDRGELIYSDYDGINSEIVFDKEGVSNFIGHNW